MATSVETSGAGAPSPPGVTTGTGTGTGTGTDGLFSPRYLAVTIGIIISVLLTAFEAMAVSTAMPVAVADLHGLPYYSLAFSSYLTLSLLGMVLAGQRSDARGPRLPYLGGIALFGAGLLAAGTATSMAQFVLGRAVQGLGGGMVIVSLFVLVGRAYPERLHSKAFSALASCWVLPGIIGPFVSGLLTERASWRWVFLGVAACIVLPLAFIARALRGLPDLPRPQAATSSGAAPGVDAARLRTVRVRAALTALGAGLFQFGSQRLDWIGALLVPLALALLVYSVPKLLPRGLFRAGRGLPTVVALRGLMAATYFGIEAFIPLMLVQERGLSPMTAGLSLAGAAVSWAFAAWSINRPFLRSRLTQAAVVRLGAGLATVALLGAVAAISPRSPQWTAAAAMFLAAGGMGLIWPNVSVLTLELSEPGDQGANSASLQVADGLGSTLSIAVAGALYHALHTSAAADRPVFVLIYGLFIVVGFAGWLIAPRVRVR
ncbi:MFS transporter [Actinocrinis puniceicyclus]|uniref:MFS transporter n=1 Tax=Actinocrinis puniceicyclus TaxID=977794 RepID=A0A8J7WNG6_9ACTN|nr:MFS transporter [Actinocrinis puniceicyclus]MBS2964548.1 MFS transporter [Actinocrinis puniceicyclus]